MDSGYYAACAGLAAQTQALDLVAHNLANLGTTGYRGEQATFRSLVAGGGLANSVISNPLNAAMNDFGVLGASRVDRTAGSLTATGNPLDLGIAGAGFFAVKSAEGVAYTRNGSFHLTAAGQLVTAQGDAALDEKGDPISLPIGQVAVSADGTVSVDGSVATKFSWRSFLLRPTCARWAMRCMRRRRVRRWPRRHPRCARACSKNRMSVRSRVWSS